jgi:anti-sigma factor RsiW
MNPKTTNSPSKPRGRRKNATILPVMLASAALFTSMAGFLGLQVAQGNDPMLGSAAAVTQSANSSGGASRSANSQSTTSNPTPVQTSTSG